MNMFHSEKCLEYFANSNQTYALRGMKSCPSKVWSMLPLFKNLLRILEKYLNSSDRFPGAASDGYFREKKKKTVINQE